MASCWFVSSAFHGRSGWTRFDVVSVSVFNVDILKEGVRPLLCGTFSSGLTLILRSASRVSFRPRTWFLSCVSGCGIVGSRLFAGGCRMGWCTALKRRSQKLFGEWLGSASVGRRVGFFYMQNSSAFLTVTFVQLSQLYIYNVSHSVQSSHVK